MPDWKHHIFVCQNRRPPGHPKGSCGERGSQDVFFALHEAREEEELWDTVKINTTNCLGPCADGAILAIYPEGVWYGGVEAKDVSEIVESHLQGGRPVQRLLLGD